MKKARHSDGPFLFLGVGSGFSERRGITAARTIHRRGTVKTTPVPVAAVKTPVATALMPVVAVKTPVATALMPVAVAKTPVVVARTPAAHQNGRAMGWGIGLPAWTKPWGYPKYSVKRSQELPVSVGADLVRRTGCEPDRARIELLLPGCSAARAWPAGANHLAG